VPAVDVFFDLGSLNTRVATLSHGIIYRSKTAVSFHRFHRTYTNYGDEAYRLMGKQTPEFSTIFPIVNGHVGDITALGEIIHHITQYVLEPYRKSRGIWKSHIHPIVAAHPFASPSQKRNLVEVFEDEIFTEPLFIKTSDALAYFMQKTEANNERVSACFHVGHGYSFFCVTQSHQTLQAHLIDFNGALIHQRVEYFLQLKHSLLFSAETILQLVEKLLTFTYEPNAPRKQKVVAKHITTGMPQTVVIDSNELYDAVIPAIDLCVAQLQKVIQHLEPAATQVIGEQGIHLTGGLGERSNLATLLSKKLALPVHATPHSQDAVIMGMVEHERAFRELGTG
jgi:rod shape-determining protein MreB